MFFLSLDLGAMLPTALFGMILTLSVFALLFLLLRLYGFSLFRRKRSFLHREKAKMPDAVADAPSESELSEEELIAILTAAAVETLGGTDAKRFCVVAFRRV